jgi:hypothetical protein
MDELEPRLDVFAPLQWLGSSKPTLVWAGMFCVVVVYFFVWPWIEKWRSRRELNKLAERDDLLEQMRVARLKQSDAMRSAIEQQRDVVPKRNRPDDNNRHRDVPRDAPRPALFFTQQAPQPGRYERRPPRFGRLPPSGGGGS